MLLLGLIKDEKKFYEIATTSTSASPSPATSRASTWKWRPIIAGKILFSLPLMVGQNKLGCLSWVQQL
jgi:hypothetical protein